MELKDDYIDDIAEEREILDDYKTMIGLPVEL